MTRDEQKLCCLAQDALRLLDKEVTPFEFGDTPDVLLELYFALGQFLLDCGESLSPDREDPLAHLHKDW